MGGFFLLASLQATKLAGFTGKLKGSVLLARHIYKVRRLRLNTCRYVQCSQSPIAQ